MTKRYRIILALHVLRVELVIIFINYDKFSSKREGTNSCQFHQTRPTGRIQWSFQRLVCVFVAFLLYFFTQHVFEILTYLLCVVDARMLLNNDTLLRGEIGARWASSEEKHFTKPVEFLYISCTFQTNQQIIYWFVLPFTLAAVITLNYFFVIRNHSQVFSQNIFSSRHHFLFYMTFVRVYVCTTFISIQHTLKYYFSSSWTSYSS